MTPRTIHKNQLPLRTLTVMVLLALASNPIYADVQASEDNETTVKKSAKRRANKTQSESTTLETMNVVDKADDNADAFYNKDPHNETYTPQRTNITTKTDTPIMETPAAVQVVPRAVMDDQKTTRIKDALENVSGVRAQSSLGMGTGFVIRGFRGGQVFRNGLLTTQSNGFESEFDSANLESVDVLKGPAAMLFGRGDPGGMINVTTKKPSAIPFYSLEQQFGSYDYYRTQWDATGAVNADNSVMYRFSGSHQDNQSFRDLIFTNRTLASAALTWLASDATDFSINVEGMDQDYQADYGIPAVGKRPAPIPISNSFGDTSDPVDHTYKIHLGTEFNHRFNKDWAIHNRFLLSRQENSMVFFNPAPAFGNALHADNRTLDRNVFAQSNDVEAYATNVDVTGKFNLGFTQHNTLVGFDFTQSHTTYHTRGNWDIPNTNTGIAATDSDANANTDLAIDIYNPQASYGNISQSLIRDTLSGAYCCGKNFSRFKTQWVGAYFQDHITLWDKLHITGGGRYDWAEVGRGRGLSLSEATYALDNSSPTVIRKDEHFSPRVGLLYQPQYWLSLYGNWTTSFGANNGVSATGAAIAPETSEQFEAGIKTALFDERLISTLAYYHLTKDNLMTSDLSTPDPTDSAAIGQARSQGIEWDVFGQITNSLSIIGSYAFTDARITKDNDGYVGSRLPNVAEHAGSLWLKYDFNGFKAVKGLSFGIGGVAASEREGNYAYYGSPFQLPGYVRMDAFAAYKWVINKTKVTAQFNIRNLLDKTYYESTDPDANVSPRLGVYPGAPLTAIGSLRVEF